MYIFGRKQPWLWNTLGSWTGGLHRPSWHRVALNQSQDHSHTFQCPGQTFKIISEEMDWNVKGLVYLTDGVWVEDIMASSHLILLSRLIKRTVPQFRDSSILKPPKYASKWRTGLYSLEVTQLWQCASAHPSSQHSVEADKQTSTPK